LYATGQLFGGGIVSTVFTRAGGAADAFSNFLFPSTFANLVSVTFVGGAVTEDSTSNFALDNIVVMPGLREVEAPVTVPEPASIALLSIGALAFGFAQSRKRRDRQLNDGAHLQW
jgi:hypothetical protein